MDRTADSTAKACLLCGSSGRLWMERSGRHLWRCGRCRALWVPEGLQRDVDGRSIYESDEPIFFADGNEAYYLDDTNFLNSRLKLDIMRRHVAQGSRVLDVGASFGHFLAVARDVYEATGVEVSPAAVDWSRRKLGVLSRVGSIYDLPAATQGAYDAVSLWDVIEHVPDPRAALQAVHRCLRPGGRIVISTPDSGSLAARLLGRHWYYLDLVQHIVLFNRQNLGALLRETGFEPIAAQAIGHHYRVAYVLTRLSYFYSRSLLGKPLALVRRLLPGIEKLTVKINPRDVVVMVGERR